MIPDAVVVTKVPCPRQKLGRSICNGRLVYDANVDPVVRYYCGHCNRTFSAAEVEALKLAMQRTPARKRPTKHQQIAMFSEGGSPTVS